MSHLDFSILALSTNYCLIKIDRSGNTVRLQASGFQNLAKLTINFGQNVNVTRFACNIE